MRRISIRTACALGALLAVGVLQAEPTTGTWRVDLGFGLGMHFGDEADEEERVTELFDFRFIIRNGSTYDTVPVEYDYLQLSPRLAVSAYITPHVAVGARYAYHATMQTTDYDRLFDDPTAYILHLNELAIQGVLTSREFKKLHLSAELSGGVAFGSLTRFPVLAQQFDADPQMELLFGLLNEPVSTVGPAFTVNVGIIGMGKREVGGVRLSFGYEVMFLHLRDDRFVHYPEDITCQNLTITAGFVLLIG
ncbi:MAG: hypothetical protein GF331_08255 [Chitinivibrionales bacterium]|nr:hypothetical protein [Chitinivibrionales bacterium]